MPRRLPALLEPLTGRTFRTIWSASLLSNFGLLILGVGAAWEMIRMTGAADQVALVQTALMLPLMLLSLPAGAIADMYDRRVVALGGLAFALVASAALAALSFAGLVTPWTLLGLTFLIGAGVAVYGPAWQASVGEQVAPEHLPSAIALGSISYNIARSFGPALGGLIVAATGAVGAFGANALLYLPIMLALFLWRREQASSRLPPERIDRAMLAGVRYAIHSPPIRVVLVRTLASALAGSSVAALTPLVARELLGGDAQTYGLLLGAFGIGAVIGATQTGWARAQTDAEPIVRKLAIAGGAMIVVAGYSRSLPLTLAALTLAGAAWMLLTAMFNVGVQLSAPRWVTARALSCWGAAVTGGMAFGAIIWGEAAAAWGTGPALILSGASLAATALLGLAMPMPTVAGAVEEMAELRADPEVALALTLRSGPIVIEIDYRVDPDEARGFYSAMLDTRKARLRSGAFEWSIARDVADPWLWTERYHCPTWADYLRQRNRATLADLQAEKVADSFHRGSLEGRVRRRLERPFGSVRWKADSPDPQGGPIGVFTP